MLQLPLTFGLLHLPTKRFARIDSVERSIFHRLNSDRSDANYRSHEVELGDQGIFYEADDLYTLLKVLRTTRDRFGRAECDDGYGRVHILNDFSDFVPVAFLRKATRLNGVGDYLIQSVSVKLVVNADEDGAVYELADIPD